jgi:hypothetical protein
MDQRKLNQGLDRREDILLFAIAIIVALMVVPALLGVL